MMALWTSSNMWSCLCLCHWVIHIINKISDTIFLNRFNFRKISLFSLFDYVRQNSCLILSYWPSPEWLSKAEKRQFVLMWATLPFSLQNILNSMKDPKIAAFWLLTMPQVVGGFNYDDEVKQKIWWAYKVRGLRFLIICLYVFNAHLH